MLTWDVKLGRHSVQFDYTGFTNDLSATMCNKAPYKQFKGIQQNLNY